MSQKKTVKISVTKKQAHRAPSNILAMFDQSQTQDLRTAFNLMDQNNDGFLDKKDLSDTLVSLGQDPNDYTLDDMVNEASVPINFPMFLTLFSERLRGTDPKDMIKNAFGCFDENDEGRIHVDLLRELLVTMGDRFTDEDVDEILCEAPVSDGKFNYIEFIRIFKHGEKEKNDV